MTITVGTDTYVTVVEADTYFAARMGFDSWAVLDEPTKEKALVSATQQLDTLCSWYGSKCDSAQNLAHPRTADCPDVPQDIKDAQCEIAFPVSVNGTASTAGEQELKSMDAQGKLEWFEGVTPGNILVNPLVSSLLSPYGLCSGGGSTTIIPTGRA